MSKLKIDEINFDDADFVVGVEVAKTKKQKNVSHESKQLDEIQDDHKAQLQKIEQVKLEKERLQKEVSEAELKLNRARQDAQDIFEAAQKQASELVENTMNEVEEQKNAILEQANLQAQEIIENAKTSSETQTQELITKSKDDIEQERITTIKNAYDDGYKDGLERIQQELEEKIEGLNNFCSQQYQIRDKIIKSANKDILDLVVNISKKILLKEVDAQTIGKIVKNTISLLEKKENVNIILSEKYAKLLYEYQKETLADETEFKFDDFKQFENFDVVYNPAFDDDTIIVENLKERYDASINSQLDVIIRNIYDNTQNGKLDLEQYENEAE